MDMSFNYSTQDLDVLLTGIDEAIAAIKTERPFISREMNTLISIAEAAKEYVQSAIKDYPQNDDFLNALLRSLSRSSLPDPSCYSHPLALHHAAPPTSTDVPLVKNSLGAKLILGKRLGRGGEGSVYKIPSMPGKVAKIYSKERLAGSAASELKRKITTLSQKNRVSHLDESLVAALPDEPLFFLDGSFAGYVMPQLATTTKIYEIQRDDRRSKLFPDLDYRGLVAIAYNLAEVVDHLHKNGIVVGDMNQNNILIHQDGTVTLIDCDSFDISDPVTGEHFPCAVGLQELLAPELQTIGSLKNGTFTKESDYFSLAIHIFRLLMNNADPFAGTVTGIESMSNLPGNYAIVTGECAYVRNIPGKEIPSWSLSLDILPKEIQLLFHRVFDYTANTLTQSIGNRPSAAEWMNALHNFYHMPMTHCTQNPFHWYSLSQTRCPFCSQT